ncbi:MAG: hypothetical protein FJ110_16535 [Deltaproteobacteria bacterium]|nr:hypothetical protein [Deltaproteobacteria bacterium]
MRLRRKDNPRSRKTGMLSVESGTPLFEMDIDVEVPHSVSEQGLRKDLHGLANELMIDLVLRKV